LGRGLYKDIAPTDKRHDSLVWKGFDTYDVDAAQKMRAQEDLILELRSVILIP
jgi:hypothetical protein